MVLVVLGHSIQYGSGTEVLNNNFFGDIVVKFIYSFHMPLFMLISGYLFYFTNNKYTTKQVIIKKAKTLIVPIAIWSILVTLLDVLFYDFQKLFDPWGLFKLYCNEFIGQFWFLWAVFLCSLIVTVIKRFFNDNIIAYTIVFIISFVTPDIILFALYKFMYPFFVIGYMFKKYNLDKKIKSKFGNICFLCSLIIFIIMLVFYQDNYYIYVSGFTLLGQKSILNMLYIDLYRIIIGLVGSFVFIYLFVKFSKFIRGLVSRVLLHIGKNTMGIYIISFFLCVYLLPPLTIQLTGTNYFVAILETILTLAVSLLVIFIINRTKLSNKLLLGIWK